MSTISVVTPSLNKKKFISSCISSVRSQSDHILEHIIWDGVSTDGTLDVIREEAHSKLQLIIQKDESQADALNKLFQIAKGDYVCWLNSDDMLAPNALRNVSPLLSSRSYDVVYGDWLRIDDLDNSEIRITPGPFRYQYLKRIGCYIPSSGSFFKTQFLRAHKIKLDVGLRYVMDYDLFLNLSERGATFAYLNEILSHFRMYDGNLTSHTKSRRVERRAVQRKRGMAMKESLFGKLNMWVQYYVFKCAYLVEQKVRLLIG